MRKKSVEDYLEVIYTLASKKGYARIVEIASELKVKTPSATEMIQKLAKEGYIEYEPYQRIKLAKKGEELARKVYKRHKILADFLIILGIDEKVAERDACEMEHALHPETLRRFTKFVEFVRHIPQNADWLESFKKFYESDA